MNYLSVEKISKSFGERTLFKDLSFGISKGDKVALVAKNGSGKTTLLKILSQEESPDTGNVVMRNNITVGFLNQKDIKSVKTVRDYFFSDPKYDVLKRYEDLAVNAPESQEFQDVMEEMNAQNAWDIEQEADKILSAFGLKDMNHSTEFMSGGELKRIALAKVLFEKPDLLVLDEPTNHMDLDMIEWLEDFLSQQNITLFMVTHDRYFLDHICNEIIELEDETIYKYKGNFSYYLEKRDERLTVEQQTIDKASNLFRKELEWVRRQPKARGTKSKSRVDAFQDLKKIATAKVDDDKLELKVNSQRLGTKILEFHNVTKSFDDLKILEQFTYNFKRFEKIGIVGKNGVGKTSFINLVLNNLDPDKGKIVVGETISFGYYNQKGLSFDPDKKVIDVIKDIAEYIPLEKGKTITASQMLERFFFPKHMHYNYVYKLSGGEQKRLYLLTILMGNPNFLILDEPTNDLDIFTIVALEEFLQLFNGCLLVISHDRYFLNKICDHIFYFKGEGEVKQITGNYFTYREKLKEDQRQEYKDSKENNKSQAVVEVIKKEVTSTISYEERKEYNKLEKEIAKLEEQKVEAEAKMYEVSDNQDKLLELAAKIEDIKQKVEQKTERWLELAELIG